MPETEILKWLNQGALIVMAAAFLWLVRTVVGDIRHSLDSLLDRAQQTLDKLDQIEGLLQSIERNGRSR